MSDRTECGPEFSAPIPVLRMFDVGKTKDFYLDFLGFALDWEHRFEPDMPLYIQISRGGFTLHLSEHHGDGSPGAVVFAPMSGIAAFHAEISAKRIPVYAAGRRGGTVGTGDAGLGSERQPHPVLREAGGIGWHAVPSRNT